MIVRLVCETHAITTDNEAGIATGWLPGALSAAGRAAARQLGERRRDDGVDAIYVSDLRRALETVEIAFAGSLIPVAHSANRWALQHLLHGVNLEDAIATPFAWQPGWELKLP